jgi:hypothetical protein
MYLRYQQRPLRTCKNTTDNPTRLSKMNVKTNATRNKIIVSKQLKDAFDKANTMCLSESTDDECMIAWDEFQEVSLQLLNINTNETKVVNTGKNEKQSTLEKNSKKSQVDVNAWDVIS